MHKKDIPFLATTLDAMFPNAKTELYYNNEFQLLIAILMSAQATDKQVNKVNKVFFEHLIQPSDAKKIGLQGIKTYIQSISFFNNKASNILKTSEILEKKYGSVPPKNIDELTKLPGVGIKTAKVFLAVTLNAPYIGVDTHVHRVLNRLGLVKTKTPLETDKQISIGFTEKNHSMLHNTLVLFGRYHCIARKPQCTTCPLKNKCNFYTNTHRS